MANYTKDLKKKTDLKREITKFDSAFEKMKNEIHDDLMNGAALTITNLKHICLKHMSDNSSDYDIKSDVIQQRLICAYGETITVQTM